MQYRWLPRIVLAAATVVLSTPRAALAESRSDDFSDSLINSGLWAPSIAGSGPAVVEVNGRVEVSLPSDSWSEGGPDAIFWAGLESKCSLHGDFDIRVDYELLTWPEQNGVRIGISLMPTGLRAMAERTSFRGHEFGGVEAYVSDIAGGGIVTVPTTDRAGTLRLSRNGPITSAYYLDDTGVFQLVGTGLADGDAVPNILVWSHDYLFGDQTVRVAFDDYSVTADQIVCPPEPGTCTSPPDGVAALWSGDGTPVDRIGDAPTEVHGDLAYVPGLNGSAFGFDGIDDDLVADVSALDLTGSVSVEGWVQPSSTDTPRPLVEFNDGTSFGVHVWQGFPVPGALFVNFRDRLGGHNGLSTAGGALRPDRWTHFAVTYSADSGLGAIYINGRLLASLTLAPGTSLSTEMPLYLGYRRADVPDPFAGRRYVGALDDLALYARSLTQNEVGELAGASGKCSVPPPTPDPSLRKTIVFLQGACSSLEGPLDTNFGPFKDLRTLLAKEEEYGYNRSTDFLIYSYLGGTVDTDTGAWRPNAYNSTHPVSVDYSDEAVKALHDRLLLPYRAAHPNRTFILIGHSLGGLVAMEEVAQHVGSLGQSNLLSSVVTVDSPLLGLPGHLTAISHLRPCLAGVTSDAIGALYNDRAATESRLGLAVAQAAQHGVRILTAGNTSDCVMMPAACNAPIPGFLDSQWLFNSIANVGVYTVPEPCLNPIQDKCYSGTHSAVLEGKWSPRSLNDIAQFVGRQNAGTTP